MAAGGRILAKILARLEAAAVVGATGMTLEALAREMMRTNGVTASFLDYAPRGHRPYPAATCVSVNDGVVHGLPNDVPFKPGDVVGIDCGIQYQGLYLDSALTVGIAPLNRSARQLLTVTREALRRGIKAAQPRATVGDIGAAVQRYVEGEGLSVIRALVGHGVGYAVHEPPPVPNVGQPGEGVTLEPGLVIAIEPMVTYGDPAVAEGKDGWTVVTASGQLAAHFEHTVAVTEAGPRVLTRNP